MRQSPWPQVGPVADGKADCARRLRGRVRVLLALAVLGAVCGTPLALAQGHEHGNQGPTLLTHDGPVDGRQFVGNLAHFAAIAHGEDAIPDFHQDVPMRISLNGRVLFESTPDSGHDYDGINVVDVVFPETGPYVVEALDAAGNAVATFAGQVLPAPDMEAALSANGWMEQASVGDAVSFTYWVSSNETASDVVPHTDCWFEVLRDGRTEFRTKTHTHEEKQVVEYAFGQAGPHVARATCFQAYPSAKATLFAPVVREQTIEVQPALADGIPAGTPGLDAPVLPPAAQNAVVQGAAGGELLLVGTFDPYTVVGPDTVQHLVVAAVDPVSGAPRQHVDFTATFTGPAGVIFSSETLHEYDGLYEFAARQAVPGVYTLRVTADAGEWSDSIAMAYTVAPPAAPTSAGLVSFDLANPGANEGVVGDYRFDAQATSGPFAHSEIELRVLGTSSPVPLLMAKLHTHADGSFPFRLSLPEGRYVFQADGFPLTPEAVVVSADSFPVEVGPALGTSDDGLTGSPEEAPGLAVLWSAGVLLLAVVFVRRR